MMSDILANNPIVIDQVFKQFLKGFILIQSRIWW